LYEQLKSKLVELLARPRVLRPQTQRQLESHWAEQSSDLPTFFECAADVLAEHELDILFASVFTPSLDERSELAELLFHWKPDAEQLQKLVGELSIEIQYASVQMPDGRAARLKLHEVMIDRYVRLLRLDAGPDPATAAAMRDALPADLWPIAMALLCERGMTPAHQKFFATLVNHMRSHHAVTRGLLQATADFFASQKSLDPTALTASADALMRATQGTTAFASAGHNYWSPDVAQHHHYRGQGKLDEQRLRERQAELEHVTVLVDDLKTFEW
jgi:hypothetical protein